MEVTQMGLADLRPLSIQNSLVSSRTSQIKTRLQGFFPETDSCPAPPDGNGLVPMTAFVTIPKGQIRDITSLIKNCNDEECSRNMKHLLVAMIGESRRRLMNQYPQYKGKWWACFHSGKAVVPWLHLHAAIKGTCGDQGIDRVDSDLPIQFTNPGHNDIYCAWGKQLKGTIRGMAKQIWPAAAFGIGAKEWDETAEILIPAGNMDKMTVAVRDYTNGGYSRINQYLRDSNTHRPEQSRATSDQVKSIDDYFGTSKPRDSQDIVMRAQSWVEREGSAHTLGNFQSAVQIGDCIRDAAYVSTTGSIEAFFCEEWPIPQKPILHIQNRVCSFYDQCQVRQRYFGIERPRD
jgi:hypothetical protein